MSIKGQYIENTPEAWEDGLLGRDEEFVMPSPDDIEKELDSALDLQLISIRLQKSLIEDFKTIATFHGGIGYQTLMRQILRRFAVSETKRILREIAEDRKADQAASQENEEPPAGDGQSGKQRRVA